MIQAIIRKGKVIGEEIPMPNVSNGSVLIKVVNSCISAGTEMSGVTNSGKNLIRRALDQPENVKKVINMARSIGIAKTVQKVRGQLDFGYPTGYSLSGIVIGTGKGVSGFKVGDRVAAAGSGVANHAEYVDVPVNLVVPVPNELSFRQAATVALGSIALQGVRRLDTKIGEFVVVVGAGVIGLLTVQMLVASGVRVIVTDLDPKRLDIAKKLGCEFTIDPTKDNVVKTVWTYTGGHGADAVLFAAATTSSKPLAQSFQMCRKKGKVVLVGVSGMTLNRADIYKKELDFLMSTSYGPGRYDPIYEEKGIDYPYAYVRWTENRNMMEYLRLLSTGAVKLDLLISGEYPIKNVTEAYDSLRQTDNRPLIVLLYYGEADLDKLDKYLASDKKLIIRHNRDRKDSKTVNVALVGCGGFATGMHLPNIKKLHNKFHLYATMNRTGYKAKTVAVQFGADYATTNYNEILNDPQVDLVLIATGHDSHASLALQALKAGKHVFVEKPLAVNAEELRLIEDFYRNNTSGKPVLMPGFNRRFSPYAKEIKKHIAKRINPLFMHYRMNAGYIPPDSHYHEHGGRIVGEACHIIDLMTFFTEAEIESISVVSLTPKTDYYKESDNKSITLKYRDGSIATIEYFAVGSKELSKELLEIHFDGKSIVMDDYKSLKGYGIKIKELSSRMSIKGHFEELVALYDTLSGKTERWPIDLWDMLQTTNITFAVC